VGRTEVWRQRYLKSRYQNEFVASRSGMNPATRGKTGEESPRRQFGFTQWFALVKRNVIVKRRDRSQTAILLLQAPFFAVLICLVIYPLVHPANLAEIPVVGRKLGIAHFLMVVAAIWFGCNNAVRDVVGEWTIYRRERMVTVKLLPYVFSKLAVLLALCIFQCVSLLGIVYLVSGMHGNFLRELLVLLVSSMIGAGMGLSISAFSKTNESAIALLPVVLLPIIALAGAMRPIYELPQTGRQISTLIPSRWAFEANLLQEAKAEEWTPEGSLAVALPGNAASTQAGCEELLKPLPANRNETVDIAQPFFPVDVASNDDGKHIRAATAADYLCPSTEIEKLRHRYKFSLAMLGLMLVLAVAAVVAILLNRDRDPQ
jgi:ABC transport system ATP-binding/permease protein